MANTTRYWLATLKDSVGSISPEIASVTANTIGESYAVGRAGNNALIANFDRYGNILWQNTYSKSGFTLRLYKVTQDSDGNLYAAGTISTSGVPDGLLLKFDSSGGIISEIIVAKPSSPYGEYIYDVAAGSSNIVYFTGYYSSTGSDALLFVAQYTIGTTVTKNWIKSINVTGVQLYGLQILVDSTNGAYVVGRDFTNSLTVVIRYTNAGVASWQKTLDAYLVSATINSDILYLAGANTAGSTGLIVAINSTGAISKQTAVGKSWKGITTDGSNIYVVGDDSGSTSNSIIAKFDLDLANLWQRVWSDNVNSKAINLKGGMSYGASTVFVPGTVSTTPNATAVLVKVTDAGTATPAIPGSGIADVYAYRNTTLTPATVNVTINTVNFTSATDTALVGTVGLASASPSTISVVSAISALTASVDPIILLNDPTTTTTTLAPTSTTTSTSTTTTSTSTSTTTTSTSTTTTSTSTSTTTTSTTPAPLPPATKAPPKVLTITNTGSGALIIQTITFVDPPGIQHTANLTNLGGGGTVTGNANLSYSLLPGNFQIFTVEYTTTNAAPGTYTGRIIVGSSNNKTQTVTSTIVVKYS